MKLVLIIATLGLVSCGSFEAKRVDSKESDEKALTITNKWLAQDTESVVQKILNQMTKHKGYKRFRRNHDSTPTVFVGEVKNLTSEPYFPINDINDEFLNEISASGEFILVDEAAREAILSEINYQNGDMVSEATRKEVGKQTGADLIIFGNVYMKPASRDGKTIKQYSVNIRMTDIEKGVEVMRVRTKLSKYSEESKYGW
jgi:penicillin-binding protein activator